MMRSGVVFFFLLVMGCFSLLAAEPPRQAFLSNGLCYRLISELSLSFFPAATQKSWLLNQAAKAAEKSGAAPENEISEITASLRKDDKILFTEFARDIFAHSPTLQELATRWLGSPKKTSSLDDRFLDFVQSLRERHTVLIQITRWLHQVEFDLQSAERKGTSPKESSAAFTAFLESPREGFISFKAGRSPKLTPSLFEKAFTQISDMAVRLADRRENALSFSRMEMPIPYWRATEFWEKKRLLTLALVEFAVRTVREPERLKHIQELAKEVSAMSLPLDARFRKGGGPAPDQEAQKFEKEKATISDVNQALELLLEIRPKARAKAKRS